MLHEKKQQQTFSINYMMPSDEYNHVKTLIRELHGPAKNVARPPSSVSLPVDNTNNADNPNSSGGGFDNGSLEENASLLGSPSQHNISIIAGNELGRHMHPSDSSDLSLSKQNPHHFSNNSLSLPIPSLIVTGVDQNDHTFNSQRRFSQFYFGLRRFSNSHTV